MNVVNLRPDILDLAREALHKANETRLNLDLRLDHPVCCYDVCERLGVKVRFVDINMEGFYQPGTPPRIHLSSLRPLQRRHFTCAHELGHHLFGHGVSLDELGSEMREQSVRPSKELLVEMFAGHFLMPALGIRKAFHVRDVAPEHADSLTIHAVASEFGVGYDTLLTQLTFGLKYASLERKNQLSLARSQIRKTISDEIYGKGVIFLDEASAPGQISLEVGQALVVSQGACCLGTQLAEIGDTPIGSAFRASKPGQTELVIPGKPGRIAVRVTSYQFVGLAEFRFLEDMDG